MPCGVAVLFGLVRSPDPQACFALAGVAIFIKRDELKETRCVSQFDFLWAEVRPVRLDFFALRGGLCPKGWSLRGAEIL